MPDCRSKLIDERGLAVIDVRNNGDVTNLIHGTIPRRRQATAVIAGVDSQVCVGRFSRCKVIQFQQCGVFKSCGFSRRLVCYLRI